MIKSNIFNNEYNEELTNEHQRLHLDVTFMLKFNNKGVISPINKEMLFVDHIRLIYLTTSDIDEEIFCQKKIFNLFSK